MSLYAIRALPVQELADLDARLFLWTTNRFLPDALSVICEWRFVYKQTLVWAKRGASPFGGSVARNAAEFLIVAVRGSPPISERAASSVITTSLLAHSQKPDAFLDLVEQVSPGPYLEMFARRQRLGWDTWGNEALNHVEITA
jgi:N6-adenosine-specific RNA methylase IME4